LSNKLSELSDRRVTHSSVYTNEVTVIMRKG
jgi:hypothetical protein